MILTHKEIRTHILGHTGSVALWGLSSDSKKILVDKAISKKIHYIIDNNPVLENNFYNNVKIVSPAILHKNEPLLIILCGNHIPTILNQLKNQKNINYLIDFQFSKNLFPKNLTISIDYLPKNSNPNDKNYIFCEYIIKYFLKHKCNLQINHYKWWPQGISASILVNKYLKNKIKPNKNTLYISYHSIGETNPQIFRWKEGYLLNSVLFDAQGYSGWSSLLGVPLENSIKNISIKNAENHFRLIQQKFIDKNLSKYKQINFAEINFPLDFIFFPLQVFNDSVMVQSYFDPLFLFKEIVEILYKQQIPLVVKRHPYCKNQELTEILNNYIQDSKITLFEGSIHQAIAKAKTIYVINSGVGFESLLHLKPVVTFGKSDYMYVTRNIRDLAEIQNNPYYELDEDGRNKIKKFLFYFLTNKSFFITPRSIKDTLDKFTINYLNYRLHKKATNENS